LAGEQTKLLEKDFAKTGRLQWKERILKPAGVEVPEYGAHLSAELRFKRPKSATADVEAIEFGAETGAMKIATRFKLKTMTYQGEVAL
jgi:hypothetical protein